MPSICLGRATETQGEERKRREGEKGKCFSYCSIAVQKDHDQGNYYKRKTVNWGWLTVSEV